MRLVCPQCDRCVAQCQSTCTMDIRGLKCTKCIRDRQGCFWGHVSIVGRVKKGFEGKKNGMAESEEEDEDDDEDDKDDDEDDEDDDEDDEDDDEDDEDDDEDDEDDDEDD